MEHPFFTTTNTRAEALRWLTIAEKLLSTRDLMGSKSFASRAHDSDPTLSQADQILAVADTLLAGDIRIGNNNHDWYSILRITPAQGRDSDFVATQYRNLAVLLNPQTNKFAFADQAFRLVIEAWSVLSNPSRKMVYDKELLFFNQSQNQSFNDPINTLPQQQQQQQQHNVFFGGNTNSDNNNNNNNNNNNSNFQNVENVQGRPDVVELFQEQEPQYNMNFTSQGSNSVIVPSRGDTNTEFVNAFSSGTNQEGVNLNEQTEYTTASDNDGNLDVDENVEEWREEEDMEKADVEEEEERVEEPVDEYSGPTIWTACPYCFCMFEYPEMYADCCMKCQKCRWAFQAVVIPSPPADVGKEASFYCWGFMPLGLSMDYWEMNKSATPAWTPFSPMFTCPQLGNGDNGKQGGGRKDTGPKVYVGDDEVFLEFSESGESDGDGGRKHSERSNKRRAQNDKGKETPNKSRKNAPVENVTSVSAQDGLAPANSVEIHGYVTFDKVPTPSKATGGPSMNNSTLNKATVEPIMKGAMAGARKQPVRGAKNFGNLDLNMECSNEAEEPRMRTNLPSRLGRIENENIEGVGFFEGLDDYLSNHPILNVVGDASAVKAA